MNASRLLPLFRLRLGPTPCPHFCIAPALPRPIRPPGRAPLPTLSRFNSTATIPQPQSQAQGQDQDQDQDQDQQQRQQQPTYILQFTCRPCQTRSSHAISKQAYHHGSVLVKCPMCQNRHVISDHLKIFGETARSFEEILAEKGRTLRFAKVGEEGDVQLLPPEEAKEP